MIPVSRSLGGSDDHLDNNSATIRDVVQFLIFFHFFHSTPIRKSAIRRCHLFLGFDRHQTEGAVSLHRSTQTRFDERFVFKVHIPNRAWS